MANSAVKIVDSNKRLVVRLVGEGSEGPVLKINPSKLNFALNANGYIAAANATDLLPRYDLQLKEVFYDVCSGDVNGFVKLYWYQTTVDGNSNTIITMTGRDSKSFWSGGESFTLPNSSVGLANTTGNICLQTVGFQGSNTSYTIVLDFRKCPIHFSQGQESDPAAFNFGNWSPMGAGSGY